MSEGREAQKEHYRRAVRDAQLRQAEYQGRVRRANTKMASDVWKEALQQARQDEAAAWSRLNRLSRK